MQKNNLTWATVQRRVNDLIPLEVNPRKISDKQIEDLKKSLERFNLVEIPAINKDGTILAGHQRIKILKILGRGDELIDTRFPNRQLTDDEVKKYSIGSNKLGGDWDLDLLKEFDQDLLLDVGFEENEIIDIWDNILEIEDDRPEKDINISSVKESRVKPGDLVILGKHRLVCGDSNNPKILERLFEDKKASMVMSDPVYNINLDYNKGLGGNRDYGGNVKDNRSEDEYINFLRTNIKNALKHVNNDCHVFYWNTEQQIWILQTLYRELGIRNKRVCLWIKNGQNPTPQVAFSKCYEPCIYGTLGKPYLSNKQQGLNDVMNKEIGTGNDLIEDTNLWTSKRISSKEYKHATSKPVDLYEKSILRCTKPGDIIYDSFGGSGSLLIASEKLGRISYLVELEPIFCELIIRRYEKLTGNEVEILAYERQS